MFSTHSIDIDLLELHERNPSRYPGLLESVARGNVLSRYDILFAFPQESLSLDSSGKLSGEHSQGKTGFLSALDEWFKVEKSFKESSGLPFNGGWLVYLAYELAGEIEPGLKLPKSSSPQLIACAIRCPAAIIRDHDTNQMFCVAEDEHKNLIEIMEQDLYSSDHETQLENKINNVAVCTREESPQQYLDAVTEIKRYIIEGDVFQVNLSRQWTGEIENNQSAVSLYRSLRINNPAPFAGLLQLDDMSIMSSSPERLVAVKQGQVSTRPIAGTRPRSGNPQADLQLAEELLAHPKEQAEHIMLIDLERNDLGRVCKPGSIEVSELMTLESYQHVHHIVSTVQGRLQDDMGPADVIRAVFPGGTITGCPKVRCMEIIAELEKQPREAYTGSMGYINCDGSMDLNILIRTLLLKGNNLSLRAGAGIVYDSDPENELNETRAKAQGLLNALDCS